MVYWTVFLFLALMALQECHRKRTSTDLFNLCFLVLTLMVVLRKGQGQDYYNYQIVYNETVFWGKISPLLLFRLSDPLYRFLNYGAYCLGIGYPLLAAFFSLVTMIISYPFFRKQCEGSIMALFIYYCLCYIIYNFSGVRQGFTMAVEVSLLFPALLNRQWKRYYLILLPILFVHLSAIICAIFPLIARMRFSRGLLLFVVILSTPVMFAGFNVISYLPLGFITDRIGEYTSSSGHFVAYMVRMLLIVPIFCLPDAVYENDETLRIVRNIIILGYVLYAFTAFNEVLSSRINTYFRVLEAYFVYHILHKTSLQTINRQLAICFIAVYTVLFANNISAFISQGGYRHCNVFTYPYLNVFDSNDTILYYRTKLGDYSAGNLK